MIEHVWSVLCQRAILDRNTSSVSLIDIIEEFQIQDPVPPIEEGKTLTLSIPITLISLWNRNPEDLPIIAQARVLLSVPTREVVKEISTYSVDLSEKLRLRAFINIPVLQFWGSGIYRFVIQLQDGEKENWKEVASVPLKIVMQPAQEIALPETSKNTPL